MARKAKADHTPAAAVEKMAAQPPLDDDAHWLPMKAAHQRWAERTQDNELAVIELTKALAHDLPCMKRSVTGERTLVEPAMWSPDRLMLWFGNDGLRIVERVQPGQSTVLTVRGWFYVSLPHLDRICPPLASSAPVPSTQKRKQPLKRRKVKTAPPAPQAPTPQQQRKPRKQGGGRRPMYTAQQKQWLREKYSSDLKADPLLAKHEAAVPHVRELAKNEYGIEAGSDTLLDQIIRPVLHAKFSMEK